jgi:hypothetical protein
MNFLPPEVDSLFYYVPVSLDIDRLLENLSQRCSRPSRSSLSMPRQNLQQSLFDNVTDLNLALCILLVGVLLVRCSRVALTSIGLHCQNVLEFQICKD